MSIRRYVRRAVDSVSDHVDRALESLADYSLHVKYFHREVSDVWRRDDRQKKKFENRAEREEAAFQAERSENEYLRNANAAARLSRTMYAGLSERIGDSMRLSSVIGEPQFMNRYLGGGA